MASRTISKKLPNTPEARFWPFVVKSDDPNGCWIWIGSSDKKHGYGSLSISGKGYSAHRYSYFLAHGEFPKRWALHKCDNPPCVNPDHLYDGGVLENVRDMVERDRQARGAMLPAAKLDDDLVREIRRLYADGWHIRVLARRFGIQQSTMRDVVRRVSWKHVADSKELPPRTKPRHPKAKLSEEAVKVIRFLSARGVSQRRLAKAHGITKATIWYVVHERGYKSLKGESNDG